MQSNSLTFPLLNIEGSADTKITASTNYDFAERQFIELLRIENLDRKLVANPEIATEFENTLFNAINAAYQASSSNEAHRFLQRILYRVNRLYLFWYDALQHYTNERSLYLQQVRDCIETAWQAWELAQIDISAATIRYQASIN